MISSLAFADTSQLRENFLRLDGDPIAFDQIQCFIDRHENSEFVGKLRIKNKRYVTISDFNKPATQARMFILDRKTNEVRAYFISHGAGTDDGKVELFSVKDLHSSKKDQILYPQKHSNRPGSNATPRGVFLLGDTYHGSFGYSLRIHGLQKGINDKTRDRAVIMHGFQGMNPTVISSNDLDPSAILSKVGNLALSQGCTMLEPSRAKEVIDLLKGDSLYYNFTREEKLKGNSYCVDDNLMVSMRRRQ